MAQALALAERGWGRVHPNPLVGAVVVRDGAVIGRGWHDEYGGPHAEAVALAAAGDAARGATLYVTLEPCAHHGKQPPCVDAIVAAGISRVVAAMPDPNPVAGGGADRLRAAGVVVEIGAGEAQSRRQNFRFLHRFSKASRPFVAIKLAVSLDGKIADASGNSRWVSAEPARAWVHHLRAGFGAIAVGATTAVADNARLTVRGDITPRIAPVRVIFDRSGALPDSHAMLADGEGPVTVIVGSGVGTAQRDALTAAGAIVRIADGVEDALAMLAADGTDSLLVEGGGRLAGALLEAGAVDRVYQVQCPIWLGDGVPAWPGLDRPAIGQARRWELTALRGFPGSSDVLLVLEP